MVLDAARWGQLCDIIPTIRFDVLKPCDGNSALFVCDCSESDVLERIPWNRLIVLSATPTVVDGLNSLVIL